jgi:hypothetical protein
MVGVLAVPLAGHASSVTATYVAGEDVGYSRTLPTGQRVGVGGYTFPAQGTRAVKITLVDQLSPAGIPILICAGASSCTTYQHGFCTNSSGVVTLPTAVPIGYPIKVEVEPYEPGGVWANAGPCDGNGSSGTITMTYL